MPGVAQAEPVLDPAVTSTIELRRRSACFGRVAGRIDRAYAGSSSSGVIRSSSRVELTLEAAEHLVVDAPLVAERHRGATALRKHPLPNWSTIQSGWTSKKTVVF